MMSDSNDDKMMDRHKESATLRAGSYDKNSERSQQPLLGYHAPACAHGHLGWPVAESEDKDWEIVDYHGH